ncbi:MAG: hypothetical protein RM338_26360, partial [Nostoc sp. DedQUE12a]|nr:hypothetical protein [Nostoc sp. DedQUE12a]
PELIFEKPRKDGTRFTISVGKAREHLEKEGIPFSQVNKNNLDALQIVVEKMRKLQLFPITWGR